MDHFLVIYRDFCNIGPFRKLLPFKTFDHLGPFSILACLGYSGFSALTGGSDHCLATWLDLRHFLSRKLLIFSHLTSFLKKNYSKASKSYNIVSVFHERNALIFHQFLVTTR